MLELSTSRKTLVMPLSLVCLATGFLLFFTTPALANHPINLPVEVAKGDGSNKTCPSILDVQEALKSKIRETLRTSGVPKVQGGDFPCSGPEWTRVVFLNMSDPTHKCPEDWQEYNDTKRLCGRQDLRTRGFCNSFIVDTKNTEYSRVCGRVIGYPKGTVDAFQHNINSPNASESSLDGHYVDGISITYGYPPPRTHIWTLAAGDSNEDTSGCPCQGPNSIAESPTFVGDNYFCESGSETDPLWDGSGCETSWCCSFNNPPWFSVDLATPTMKQLEIRNCGSNQRRWEDTLVELMEIYIQ